MNSESNSNIQRTQSGRSISYKRAHRANRPVLVTKQNGVPLVESVAQTVEEEPSVSSPVELEEQPAISEGAGSKRGGPRFFSSVNKTEKISDQPKADPIAARLARALRGRDADAPKEKEATREKKPASSSTRVSTTVPARPKSGFKMKYIWGMMIYLLIADFLGIWIADIMQARGLDAIVFTISTFQAKRSTLIFLALLIIILLVMARLDLIPRSLGAAMSGSSTSGRNASGSNSRAATFENKEVQPSIKQGVKGANDDLYREYRENQRYFQKRDRRR